MGDWKEEVWERLGEKDVIDALVWAGDLVWGESLGLKREEGDRKATGKIFEMVARSGIKTSVLSVERGITEG